MPDVRDGFHGDDADARLVESLRALPLAHPGSDGWARMESALRLRSATTSTPLSQGRRRRLRPAYAWPFAAAAAVLAAVLWPQVPVERESTPGIVEGAASVPASDGTQALIAQSQWLERLVASDAIDAVAQDADQLIIEQGLRARIQRIDAALVNSDQPDQRLWAARVGALAQLAEVKWAGRQGGGMAMADHAALPAVMWSN